MFTPTKYKQSSHKTANLGIWQQFPRNLALKTIVHRGLAKEDHFLRVAPLLPLLHTKERRMHVPRWTLRLIACSDTDVSGFVTSVIALYLSQFYASYLPIIGSLVFRDPSMH